MLPTDTVLTSRFGGESIAIAQRELEGRGISTKVTEPANEAEFGTVFIDCAVPKQFHRSFPTFLDVESNAGAVKRAAVLWFSWPWRPGILSADNGLTLTNAGRARIRLFRDRYQGERLLYSGTVDVGIPTIYVLTELGLSKAVRAIGRELTIGPLRRRVRGLGDLLGCVGFIAFALFVCLLFLASGLAIVFSFGHMMFSFGRMMAFW